jgi:N-acetylglucosamine-6-sulfatase
MDGRSFLALAAGQAQAAEWRKQILYEYYWEFSFPQTPTTFALRNERYKFIQYHGVWDLDELYDLQSDPHEQHNLIFSQQHQQRITRMRRELHNLLLADGANRVPFSHKRRMGANLRRKGGSAPAVFPPQLLREQDAEQ